MLRNYLIIAIRNMRRHAGYTALNIAGLAVGLACVILIGLYVADEWSFDRFHAKSDRTYRIIQRIQLEDGSVIYAPPEGGLADILQREFPEVETVVRRTLSGSRKAIGKPGHEMQGVVCITDSAFFDVFDFPLVAGDRKTALRQPGGMVITRRTATALFGDEDPMGKTVEIHDDRYYGGLWTVTGIAADLPLNATIQFDFLTANPQMRKILGQFSAAGWNWYWSFRLLTTYVTLAPGASPKDVEDRIVDRIAAIAGPEFKNRNRFILQPLTDIHLRTRADFGEVRTREETIHEDGDHQMVFLFAAVAGLILLLACVNYVNLATARATSRAREVGLRKVVGALRQQIIAQFLGESLLQTAVAAIFAMMFVELALGPFNDLTRKAVSFADLGAGAWAMLLAGIVIVGLAAGFYPAFVLSGFRPVAALRGSALIRRRITLRQALVLCQFGICIALVISTIAIVQQMHYISQKHLGFQTDAIVMVPLSLDPRAKTRSTWLSGLPLLERFKSRVAEHPDVLSASACSYFLGYHEVLNLTFEGVSHKIVLMSADSDFKETLQLNMVDGQWLKSARLDSSGYYLPGQEIGAVVNEAAARMLGGNAVGKLIRMWVSPSVRITGVVRDFNDRTLREEVAPAIFLPDYKLSQVAIRMRGANIPGAMEHIARTWREFVPELPFEYRFVSDILDARYHNERRTRTLTQAFSILAIFVSAMGLIGLAAYSASQRTREIGIRKALGATGIDIFSLLSREYLKIVLAANLLAWPVAWYFARQWLDGFADRIALGAGPFILGAALALIVAGIAVSYQAISAARTQPAIALKRE